MFKVTASITGLISSLHLVQFKKDWKVITSNVLMYFPVTCEAEVRVNHGYIQSLLRTVAMGSKSRRAIIKKH
ncbi:hypothetical protein TNCV_693871 [Trichonephila clavipes]|nr:hypothetical protein TNCV_693871 [Trichonephila clavipes]